MNSDMGQLYPDEQRQVDEQSLGAMLINSRRIALA